MAQSNKGREADARIDYGGASIRIIEEEDHAGAELGPDQQAGGCDDHDSGELHTKNRQTVRVYLAGPMRGYPRYNFDRFAEAAHMLRSEGYEVASPAEHDLEEGFDPDLPLADQDWDLHASMRWDLARVLECDWVGLLEGWENSEGVALELAVARWAGKGIFTVADMITVEPPPESITQEAHRLVNGPRQGSYGHPIHDFTRTGKMWGAILGCDPIPPHLVGLCMVAVKISREVNLHKRDNLVDMAGYAETVSLVREYRD